MSADQMLQKTCVEMHPMAELPEGISNELEVKWRRDEEGFQLPSHEIWM